MYWYDAKSHHISITIIVHSWSKNNMILSWELLIENRLGLQIYFKSNLFRKRYMLYSKFCSRSGISTNVPSIGLVSIIRSVQYFFIGRTARRKTDVLAFGHSHVVLWSTSTARGDIQIILEPWNKPLATGERFKRVRGIGTQRWFCFGTIWLLAAHFFVHGIGWK